MGAVMRQSTPWHRRSVVMVMRRLLLRVANHNRAGNKFTAKVMTNKIRPSAMRKSD